MIPFRRLLWTCCNLCIIISLGTVFLWLLMYFFCDFYELLDVVCADAVYDPVLYIAAFYFSWMFLFAGALIGYRLRVVELKLKVD